MRRFLAVSIFASLALGSADMFLLNAKKVLVVISRGPSAAKFKPNMQVEEEALKNLVEGDEIQILESSGTRWIKGPDKAKVVDADRMQQLKGILNSGGPGKGRKAGVASLNDAPSSADYDCALYGECGASIALGESNDERESVRGGFTLRRPAKASAVMSARARAALRPAAARARSDSGIAFPMGSSALPPAARQNLDALAVSLLRPDRMDQRLRIEGHADAAGDAIANQKLSLDRAQAVLDYLVSKGVAKMRLEAVGYGESHLLNGVAPNAPANRRVVVRQIDAMPLAFPEKMAAPVIAPAPVPADPPKP